MRILLLSAYDAISHRRWREGLVNALPDIKWTVCALPPRHFAWRHRGSALSWAAGSREILASGHDLLVATSMTDLASLKGLVPELAALPTVVYFHENQFAYPERFDRKEGANFKLTNITTALSADRVVFNSAYNRDSFLKGARDFLQGMPDFAEGSVIGAIGERSEVIPVPLEERCYGTRREGRSGPLRILWNHRWEHDKAPERFFASLFALAGRGLTFQVCVLGQGFRQVPEVFKEARKRLGKSVVHWGYIQETEKYLEILGSCDVAVSTALHDFQGLALLEAVAGGCVPLAPDRLAYREFFPEEFLFSSRPDDPDGESSILAGCLERMVRDPAAVRGKAPPGLSWLSWKNMAGRYRALLEEAAVTKGK